MFYKKKANSILEKYQHLKEEHFSFDRIVSFCKSTDKSSCRQVISENTCRDLDFDELFMLIDRTCSKVGQQYLYHNLRTIPNCNDRFLRSESIIDFLSKNPEIKEKVVIELSKLNNSSAYYLQSLIYGKHLEKPKWFWGVKILLVLSILSIALIFYKPIFFLLFLTVTIINVVLHFWNKNNITQYSNAIPQLIILHKVANQLHHLGIPTGNEKQLKKGLEAVKKIRSKASVFKMEAQLNSDLGQVADSFVEMIKMIFLIEPIMLFKVLDELEDKKEDILTLFTTVGKIDTAISIDSFRKSLRYYSIPVFTDPEKSIYCKEIYHPLLSEPVANSLDISDSKSILISGSNMSGKTTFIRTIGINCILAQTINTVLAKEMVMPKMDVYSAIRISDDLLDEKSYYMEEVLTIKEMIRMSENEQQGLFLLDELFKGTNTTERIAAGKAVLSYLNQNNNMVFASTHDLELTDHLSDSFNFYHFTEIIEHDALSFDYQLKDGKLIHTNAIRILEINEYPKQIIKEARELTKGRGNA